MKKVKYTTRQINMNFRIKVFGFINGIKVNTLVGVSGLIRMIGESFAAKFINKAFESLEDVCIFKLRRGVKVSFYVK